MKRMEWLTIAAICLVLTSGIARAGTHIYVLNVGYGTAIHIQSDDADFLIDTGPADHAEQLLQHLSETRVTRLQAIFLTHIYPEHTGGLQKIWDQIPVDLVAWNGQDEDAPQMAQMLEKLKPPENVKIIRGGQTFNISSTGAKLTVLTTALDDSPSPNDHGLVFLLSDGRARVLFPGDASLTRQREIAALHKKELRNVRLLAWPDHGNTAAPEFFDAMPHLRYAVISVGKKTATLPNPADGKQAADHTVELASTGDGEMITYYASDDIQRLIVSPTR